MNFFIIYIHTYFNSYTMTTFTVYVWVECVRHEITISPRLVWTFALERGLTQHLKDNNIWRDYMRSSYMVFKKRECNKELTCIIDNIEIDVYFVDDN